jgi:membrane protein DedA with SNARE-associated domain
VLHPERFAKFERRFAEHGNWAIFTCRFLPGLRIPGYFLAGTMKMSYARFLLLDGLGVLISVPTSIWAAYWITMKLGEAQAQERVHQFLLGLMVAVLVLAVGWVLYRAWRKRRST